VILGFGIEFHIFYFSFFLSVGKGAPTVASGPPSATFPSLAKTSSYATGPRLNFRELSFTRLY